MRHLFSATQLLVTTVAALLVACDEPNAAEYSGFMRVSHRFNADTLFVDMTPEAGSTLVYDRLKITESLSGSSTEVAGDAPTAYLTRLPYNELLSVKVLALKDGREVGSHEFDTRIDGLDRRIASIIIPNTGSVTGGDGMYSISLPDGRSLFLIGDSFTSDVINDQRQGGHMYRNSYILYDNGRVRAITNANGPNTSAAVPPGVSDEGQEWYWPGHGFARGNKLYIFHSLMNQGADGMWGFRYDTTHILEYDLPGINLARTMVIPFNGSKDIHYGAATLDNGDYIYIYAQVDVENDFDPISEVLVARTTIGSIDRNWEYYTGYGWSGDQTHAARLEGLQSVPISSQFNVYKIDGKYVLFTQNKTYASGEIYSFVADNPWGPWSGGKQLYKTTEQEKEGVFTYNAMLHPQFEHDGAILVSYNVNSNDFAATFTNVSSYRPKFFWVRKETILNN